MPFFQPISFISTYIHTEKSCDNFVLNLKVFFFGLFVWVFFFFVQYFPMINTSMSLSLFANTICDIIITRKDYAYLEKALNK